MDGAQKRKQSGAQNRKRKKKASEQQYKLSTAMSSFLKGGKGPLKGKVLKFILLRL